MSTNKIGSAHYSDKEMNEGLGINANGQVVNYTGEGDSVLDFNEGVDFSTEHETAKDVTIVVTNSGTAAKKIAFFGGPDCELDSDVEVLKDGSDDDSDLEVECSPNSLAFLQKYIQQNPSRLAKIQISVDDASQLKNRLKHIVYNPWQSSVTKQINPERFVNGSTNNNKVVVIEDLQNWTVSSLRSLQTTIGAGRTATYNITFGASLDLDHGLVKKAADGKKGLLLRKVKMAQAKN